ncbi:MAG TPA: hypothetical protein VMX12_07530 [Acidimicrobiia bacterium]|nr:hypothetical protein [Acidimicrobiia bacterium]
MSGGVVIRLVEHAGLEINEDGSVSGPTGLIERAFVRSYDPEGHDGLGDLLITADRSKAHVYDDMSEAFAAYNAQPSCRPLRGDGQPNRPLAAFTVSFERADSDG